jgi:peroxiredoxin
MLKRTGLTALAMAIMCAFGTATWADAAKVGEPAPDWELTNVSDGSTVKLSDIDGIVVMVWQSKDCPWDKMVATRGYQRVLTPLATQYAEKGVTFVAINSNKTETAEQLASYHKEAGMSYPILKDPGNKVADLYGARTTPHIFIRDAAGTLIYKGGIEQVPTSPEKCGEMDEQYLVPVLNAALAGETLPYTETVSKGCTLKRE